MARHEFSRKIKAAAIARAAGKCSVEGCDRKHFCKGFCSPHFMRWRRHGDPCAPVATSPGEARSFLDVIPETGDGCLIWPFARDQNGYAKIGTKSKTSFVSRLLCARTYGERGKEFDAAHSCGGGHLGCVSPWHLSWKTRQGNMSDTLTHGTRQRKLDEVQVAEIRRLAATMSKQEIADKFGVTRQAISWIVNRKGWAHVA
jgi:hypothetical protein